MSNAVPNGFRKTLSGSRAGLRTTVSGAFGFSPGSATGYSGMLAFNLTPLSAGKFPKDSLFRRPPVCHSFARFQTPDA